MLKLDPLAVADYTRCALALIIYGGTLALLLAGVAIPDRWWYAVAGITGFYFALEAPRAWRDRNPPPAEKRDRE